MDPETIMTIINMLGSKEMTLNIQSMDANSEEEEQELLLQSRALREFRESLDRYIELEVAQVEGM